MFNHLSENTNQETAKDAKSAMPRQLFLMLSQNPLFLGALGVLGGQKRPNCDSP
jgi:hypothetical protein